MFLGSYKVRLRAKNRIAFPAKLRDLTGDTLFITNWFENSLIVLPKKDWENLTKDLFSEKSYLLPEVRELERFIMGGTFELNLDSEGRFILPSDLLKYAKIKDEVVFVGGMWYIQIWDQKLYESYRDLNKLQIKNNATIVYEKLTQK